MTITGLFDDLIGQPLAVDLLEAALDQQRLAPAYLFAGPDGVGRRLARAARAARRGARPVVRRLAAAGEAVAGSVGHLVHGELRDLAERDARVRAAAARPQPALGVEPAVGARDLRGERGFGRRVFEHDVRALVQVLGLFRGGVLIMDEVDLLLHPLKSELNFPIGDKHKLDFSPERWTCAIHALDAVFYLERKSMSVPFHQSGRAHKILDELQKVIEEGYSQRALQRSPHASAGSMVGVP